MVSRRQVTKGAVGGIAISGIGLAAAANLTSWPSPKKGNTTECRIRKTGKTTSAILVVAPVTVSPEDVELKLQIRDDQVSHLKAHTNEEILDKTPVSQNDEAVTLSFPRHNKFTVTVSGTDNSTLGYQRFKTVCDENGNAKFDSNP